MDLERAAELNERGDESPRSRGASMAGHQGLEVLIGIAVALLVTWLLGIAALAIGRPKGKMLQLEAAYRWFSWVVPCPAATKGCGWNCWLE